MDGVGIVTAIFSSAALQMYFLRLPDNEGTFVRTVLESFEELLRAVRGEAVRLYKIHGMCGLLMPENSQANTPWGNLRAAPRFDPTSANHPFLRPHTTAILLQTKLTTVRFDRAASPAPYEDADASAPDFTYLLPIACALASPDLEKPVVPMFTWSVAILPFQPNNGYSWTHLPPKQWPVEDFSSVVGDLEHWSRLVHKSHHSSIDIAVRRLTSAVASRVDQSDALIDSVMAWENLLGTSTEVTYRVSASLAKLIEPVVENRKILRKRLTEIYAIRSRLVHGGLVEQTQINDACKEAISYTVKSLRACYEKGPAWLALKSQDRSDHLLLESP